MLSRDSQSTQLQNSPLPSKQVGGHCSIGMRRIYSSKTIETHSGLSANNLVYMCLHIPTNQLLIHQDIGLLLHPVGHFSPPRSLFLALTLIFAEPQLPEQWPVLPFVSPISLPTIEICNACGLITSQETEQALLVFFLQNIEKVGFRACSGARPLP